MITLSLAARTAAANAIAAQVDAANGPGKIKISASNLTTLAIITLSKPAFAPAANGAATLTTPITDVPVIATGTAATYELTDGAGNLVMTGTVGQTDSDMNFPNITWTAGDVVDLASYRIAVPGE